MVMINGWEIDYTLLSNPDAPLPFTPEPYDRVVEHADADMACFVWCTGELAINMQVGDFAVFRQKASPELVFYSCTLEVWWPLLPNSATFSSDGSLLAVTLYLYEGYMKDNRQILGVFDFGRRVYAFLHGGFALVDDRFVAPDGTTYTPEQLVWHGLSEIEHLREQVLAAENPST